MDFRVLLVDDEKTALDNLIYILKHYHPDFHIAGCARNGNEALRFAQEQLPDLVLTDIRMPHMNGLELVECLHNQMPTVYSIIISGYADFEYVRAGMIHGSIDYLLKPVDPQQMKDTLKRATPFIQKNLYKKRVDMIHKLCKGEALHLRECARYFPEHAYGAAITRKNGLPVRAAQAASIELFSDEGTIIDLYGRDEMESLYIFPSGLMNPSEIIPFTQKPFDQITGYTTTVVWKTDFEIASAPAVIESLYQTLNSCLVVGKSQVIYLDEDSCKVEYVHKGKVPWNKDFLQQITRNINNRDHVQINKYIDHLLIQSKAFEVPEFLLEDIVRPILCQMNAAEKQAVSDYSLRAMIDDLFCHATSFEELHDGIFALVNEILQKPTDHTSSNRAMYDYICDYIDEHLAEPLSLLQICNQYGISQPTLSKLFREHANLSFNRFLTNKRVDQAIVLLADNSLLVRDIAAQVGYADQFYFSRIFRSVVGVSPTEYAAKNDKI